MNGWVLASEDQLHNDEMQGESESNAKANSKGGDDIKPRCRVDYHVRGGACCRGFIRLDKSRRTVRIQCRFQRIPSREIYDSASGREYQWRNTDNKRRWQDIWSPADQFC